MTNKPATWQCGALKQGTTAGNDPADCNWPFCGCDPHAGKVVATLQECGWGPHGKINNVFPQRCDLCNTDMTSPEDRMEWHGLGNCVEICERCTGSGIEPKDAAPELLEALKNLLSVYQKLYNKDEKTPAIRQAEAAIAKAEG